MRRNRARPTSTAWLNKLRRALNLTAEDLAKVLKIDEHHAYALCASDQIEPIELDDEVLERLLTFVNERIAAALAARDELQPRVMKMRNDRIIRRAMARG